ncbi:F-BAR domain only protein 1 isoform X1 [Chelonia mydas]|uniref:F-BAR domain only protein 1 isoform X1 n=1 Tax=Chelonia mydas TaxID=8469 RepID=UPI001CA7EE9A|nr:F-BAR domain only protein 1 isoform X1 [Chelonia mydas]
MSCFGEHFWLAAGKGNSPGRTAELPKYLDDGCTLCGEIRAPPLPCRQSPAGPGGLAALGRFLAGGSRDGGDLRQGEKNQGFDVLYHNVKHGQVSTKELADFVRERATVEETYGKSMAKLAKMATNGTQLGTFAPLWEVFRVSSDKLALCHLELVKKLHDLLKEIARYGEEQGKAHKKSKEEVSGTLEAIQLLQGVAQLVPKSKENYHSKCLEAERLRREGTNQKEIDKAERKSKKAAEALRRAVEKYNMARADFEQRMLDSAVRFQELEETHLRHMKGLISSYSHSVEDTHVQIGQVHEEFKQNVENIGIEMLLQRFAESKGTGRERPGVLDFDECRTVPAQEGKAQEEPQQSLPHPRAEPERPRARHCTCPDVDEEGFTVRPDINQSSSGGTHGCSSSDSDYEDEDEPRKFYVRIKPLQPCDTAGSGQAAVEQLKATVGNLPLPPSTGGTVKRQSCRHLPVATTVTVDVGSVRALGTGDESGKLQPPHPAVWTPSCAGKPRPDVAPSAALFGPPLESAFEAEDFPASRACGLGSSPSPFSSSSPENVEDSGLDSPSHPPTGPSPDSRPWTPQSPLARRPAKGSPRLQEERGALPPMTTALEEQSAWLPPPASPTGWPQDTPCFAAFGSEPSGEDSGAGSRHDSRYPSATAPSPDPSGDPQASVARPPSPVLDQALQPCKHGACPPSNTSSSPVPPSCREPSGSSPWTPQGPGPRLTDSSTLAIPELRAEPGEYGPGGCERTCLSAPCFPEHESGVLQGAVTFPPPPQLLFWWPSIQPCSPPKCPLLSQLWAPPSSAGAPRSHPTAPESPLLSQLWAPPQLCWCPSVLTSASPTVLAPGLSGTGRSDPPGALSEEETCLFRCQAESLPCVTQLWFLSSWTEPGTRLGGTPAPASPPHSHLPCASPPPAPNAMGQTLTHPRLSPLPCASADPPPAPAPPSAAPKVAPPRRSRTKRPSKGQAACSHGDLSRSLSPSPLWNSGPSHSAPPSLGERSFFTVSQPALGLSRGPSPVVLGSQDALPVATAFTEYIHAYFKGQDPNSCLVKITGELTMSFPAGIVHVFSGSPAPPVLSFRLLNTALIEQFLPSAELVYSDPSQSDPSTKDFWLNMPALTGHLQKQAEQAPAASYYNVALLKYQLSKLGPSAAPLQLAVRWDCTTAATQVSVEYGYNAGAMATPRPLANVQVLLPVEEPVANVRLQPAASWNLEEKRLLWRLLDVPGAPDRGGCGHLSASWEPLYGPSKPSPVAAQFTSEGSTLSGVEVQLAGSGYRMSLVKKRFATGIYLAGS